MNGETFTSTEQCRTRGVQITRRSPIVISGEQEEDITEEQKQRRHSQRQETAEDRRSSNGCANTRNLRRLFSICGFLLSDYNDFGQTSANYRHISGDLTGIVDLSGSEDESAYPRRSMSQHYQPSSSNHRPTDGSTADQQPIPPACPNHPSGIFGHIKDGWIFVTIAPYGWRIYSRRESANEYIVRYENAMGALSGKFHIDRREARRLVDENCREAVWTDIRARDAWPGAEQGGSRR